MDAGLYIHIPFCSHICGYCDFYTVALRDSAVPTYIKTLEREIQLYCRDSFCEDLRFDTLYFGGGTPSLLTSAQLARLIDCATNKFNFVGAPEVTVETNPGTVDLAKLRGFRAVGVNRLSLGVQALDPKAVANLDRDHGVKESLDAYRDARQADFSNINLDLIFGVTDQTLSDWQATLEKAIEMGPEHVSAYNLTYEEGTPFHRKLRRGLLRTTTHRLYRQMFGTALEQLRKSGFRHYEVSNYARPGYECHHNQKYWDGSPYLGLGVSSHSFNGEKRSWNVRNMGKYQELLERQLPPLEGHEVLSRETRMFESVLLGLRQRKGLHLQSFESDFGVCFFGHFAPPLSTFFDLPFDSQKRLREIKNGLRNLRSRFLVVENGFLKLTDEGVMLSDSVCAEFA